MTICRNRKYKKSFTLIELLIVIAIIGLISSIVLVNTMDTRGKARIAKILEFSQSVQTVIGAYAVGIWSFDLIDSGQVLDRSGYDNHGTVNGASLVADLDQLGNALSFDGVDDYVALPQIFSGHDVTIEFWVKRENGAVYTWPHILNNNGWAGFLAHAHNANGRLWIGTQGSLVTTGTDFFPAGEWVHVAYTRSDAQRLYRNGAFDREFADAANTWGDSTTISAAGAAWRGLIDEVRIYTEAFSIGQIQQHYAEGLERHKNLVIQ